MIDGMDEQMDWTLYKDISEVTAPSDQRTCR